MILGGVDDFQNENGGRRKRKSDVQQKLFTLLQRLDLIPSFSSAMMVSKNVSQMDEETNLHSIVKGGEGYFSLNTRSQNDQEDMHENYARKDSLSSPKSCYTRTSKTIKDYDVNGNFLRYRMTDLLLKSKDISSNEIKLLCHIFLFPKDHKHKYHFMVDENVEEFISSTSLVNFVPEEVQSSESRTNIGSTKSKKDIINGVDVSPGLLLSLVKWTNEFMQNDLPSSSEYSLDAFTDNNLQLPSLPSSLIRFLNMNINLHSLQLSGNFLGDEGALILTEALAFHPSLHTLDLGFNGIGDIGAERLKELLLPGHPLAVSLRTLYLSGNKIGPFGGLALAQGIQYNDTLETLHLSSNAIGEAAVPLGEALTTNGGLKKLYLAGTKMGSQWGPLFLSSLSKNQHLECLYLMDNDIKDHGMYALAKAIEIKKNFRVLELSFNQITQVGIGFLASAFSAHFFGNQNQSSDDRHGGHYTDLHEIHGDRRFDVAKTSDTMVMNDNNSNQNKDQPYNLDFQMDIESKTSLTDQIDRKDTPNIIFTNFSYRPQNGSTDTLSISNVGVEGINYRNECEGSTPDNNGKDAFTTSKNHTNNNYFLKSHNYYESLDQPYPVCKNNESKKSIIYQKDFGYPALEELYLDNNELLDEGVECLASQALPYLSSLHTLNVGYNGIRSSLGIKALSTYLNLAPSLPTNISLVDGEKKTLFEGNDVYNQTKMQMLPTQQNLVCNLKRLFLCGTKFDVQACKYLGQILHKNKSLEEVVIDSSGGTGVSSGGGISASNDETVDVMDKDLHPISIYPSEQYFNGDSNLSSTSTSSDNHSTNRRGRRFDQMRNETRRNHFGDKGESYIVRGILQNPHSRLRKFTGFQLAPVFQKVTRDYFMALKTREINSHMNSDQTNAEIGTMEEYVKNLSTEKVEEKLQAHFSTLRNKIVFPFPYIYSDDYRKKLKHSTIPQLDCNISLGMDVYTIKNELALRIIQDHHLSLKRKSENDNQKSERLNMKENKKNKKSGHMTAKEYDSCFHTLKAPHSLIKDRHLNTDNGYLRHKIGIGRVKLGQNSQTIDTTTKFEGEGSFSTNITPILPYQNISVQVCNKNEQNDLKAKQGSDIKNYTEYFPSQIDSSGTESPNTPAYDYELNNYQKCRTNCQGTYNELECKNEYTN